MRSSSTTSFFRFVWTLRKIVSTYPFLLTKWKREKKSNKSEQLHDRSYGSPAECLWRDWVPPWSLKSTCISCFEYSQRRVFLCVRFLCRVCSAFLATWEERLLEMNVIVVLSDFPCFFLLSSSLLFLDSCWKQIVAKSERVYHSEG